ncbi:MAG TPA: alpha/beta hydrolase family protein [Acidimicrobiia bacterium]
MHPVDRAAGLLYRHGPASWRMFTDGWGDETLIDRLQVAEAPPPESITIDWRESPRRDGIVVRDGAFVSPAEHLPEWSRVARVRLVAPVAPNGRLVVLMAAWNDHDWDTRSGLADRLAAGGVTSVMLENPYFGHRRPVEGRAIGSVADFAVMGHATVHEGRALVAHFADTHQVGVAGYSMGGNMAAFVGALSDRPVAIAPLAASHSPAPVWLDGIARVVIDWEALGGTEREARLRATMARVSVLAIPPPPHTAAAVIVGSRRDGYIPASAVEALHAHWPGSELRWLRGGHATMIWYRKDALADAIVAAFDRTFGPVM